VYPGSFDPITNGHLSIIKRARAIFDRVVVAVLDNESKRTLFTPDERIRLIESSLDGAAGIEARKFTGLLVDFLDSMDARVIVRGLRFVSDFEYELQMALMNQSLTPDVETLFMAAEPEKTFVSSSLVKEVARRGRDISAYVPPAVAQALKEKLG